MMSKLKPLLPPFLLLFASLTLFWPALLDPDLILYPTFSDVSDIMVIHWPKAHLMAQNWQAGAGLPHWNPHILSGMPLAANQLAMLSYPPAWLFLLLPLEPVFNLLFVFHLLLGGFGTYLLLRRGYGLSQPAALLGSLTFALNGKWFAHAVGGHVSLVGAVGWMPWTLFGLQMLLNRRAEAQSGRVSLHLPNLAWATLAAVSLAMQMVTHTLPVIYSVYLMAAMVGWHLPWSAVRRKSQTRSRPAEASTPGLEPAGGSTLELFEAKPHDLTSTRATGPLGDLQRLWLPLLVIPILAGLLSAGQTLPLLELAPLSNRSLNLAQAAEFALSPIRLLIGLFLPSAQGGHEYVIYLGLIPLVLAFFGLTRRNPWSWFYGGLFLVTILFALGPATPVHNLFYNFAPGFSWVRTPARIFFVSALALAVLVGFGLDRLASTHWPAKAQQWLTRLAVAAAFLALMLGLGLAFGFNQLGRAALSLAVFVPVGLVVALLWLRRVISPRLASILLGVTLFLDLASFDLSLMRFVSPAEALAPGRSTAAYLARKQEQFRVYSPSYSLPMQTAAAQQLFLADGVEPVHLAIYDDYMARAGGYDKPGFSVTIPHFGDGPIETALQDTEPNLKLLGLLNVTYIAAAFPMNWPGLTLETEITGTYIYTNEAALPRAWVAHQSLPVKANWLDQLERLPNLADVVLVEKEFQAGGGAHPASPARITDYSADRLQVETTIEQPGWLVLSEIWYPGWQATVNGQERPVAKVNGLLRGVHLEQPGLYHVALTYQPQSVSLGNWIAGVAAALLLAGWLYLAGSTSAIFESFIR
jgi:hypothetical protein